MCVVTKCKWIGLIDSFEIKMKSYNFISAVVYNWWRLAVECITLDKPVAYLGGGEGIRLSPSPLARKNKPCMAIRKKHGLSLCERISGQIWNASSMNSYIHHCPIVVLNPVFFYYNLSKMITNYEPYSRLKKWLAAKKIENTWTTLNFPF